MIQYIDKAALVAEIERRATFFLDESKKKPTSDDSSCAVALYGLLSFLDTLEVKKETILNELLTSSELLTASADYAKEQLANPDYPTYNDEYELLCAFEAGAKWQKEQTIDKACEWLADNYSKYIITNGLATIFSATIDFDTIRMIEDFKKAMKE